MTTNNYLKLILQNISTVYLLFLLTFILTSWFIELFNWPLRTNDSSSPRSHFFIPIMKFSKYKIEIIIFTLITLLILNMYSFSYLQKTIIKLLSLVFTISGSIEIIKTFKQEKQVRHNIEQLDRRKSEFLADIAHKLKTPLTIVRANINLTRMEVEENNLAEAQKSTVRSAQSIDKLARLCTNLITLGKIDFGISKLHKKEIDISQLVESSANDFKVILGDRELKHKIEPNIKIFGDSDRLQEMILNLLDNAVKFTDEEKGKIEVGLKTVEDRLRLRSSYRHASIEDRFQTNNQTDRRNEHRHPNRQTIDQKNTIELTIQDNGIGIDETVLPNLFTRYYQAESRSGSAGIGLAICKWITEGHGGKIEIESLKGKGTKITAVFKSD